MQTVAGFIEYLVHMKLFIRSGWVMFLCLTGISPSVAQEWSRFRGPNGSGISLAKSIPAKWTATDFNWKVALPGAGHSSPVLWGEKVFLTAADEKAGQFFILCVDAIDGRTLWQTASKLTPFPKHEYNAFAASTAAVDAARVYVCRTEAGHNLLRALDHKGETVWERDLGPFAAQHGGGTSPIVHEGMVILGNEQDGDSFLIALDARTGATRWKTSRQTSSTAYATPCLYQPTDGPPALIFNSQAHGISAIAPDTGKVLWEFASAFDKRCVSSPIIAAGLLVGTCGSGGGGNYLVAIRPGAAAGGKPPAKAYDLRRSMPYVPTGIGLGDWLFLWSDAGIVSRVNAASGVVQWQERVGGNFFGSPVCVDGRLFCVSTSGEVVVVSASEKFEVLARNPLGELTHSTPAVANGRMYIRTSQHLISVGGTGKPQEQTEKRAE